MKFFLALYLTLPQTIFCIVTPIVVIIGIVLAIYIPVSRKERKTKYKEYTYKQLYKIAMNQDYYLINNFVFRSDSVVFKIDHLLFADKFIYVINDCCFTGDITGKQEDSSIILVPKNGPKVYEDNPIALNKKTLSKLSLITGIDAGLMIGLVVVNDDCHIGIESKSKQFYFIQANRLKTLVKAIENRNVGKINAEQLANAVKAVAKLNRRKKNI